MPKTLVVGTEEFEFPNQGENADYGEQITDWASAVSDALTTVQQPNDILVTTSVISNNVSSPANIPGFTFNTSEVISVDAQCTITRTTDSPAVVLVEYFTIKSTFDGTDWSTSVESEGDDSGVELDIITSGQVQYTSTNLVGTNYVGEVLFKAKVFNAAE